MLLCPKSHDTEEEESEKRKREQRGKGGGGGERKRREEGEERARREDTKSRVYHQVKYSHSSILSRSLSLCLSVVYLSLPT